MKKYSIVFLIYTGILCLAYYGSYRMTYEHYKKENEGRISEEVMKTNVSEPQILKTDTEYVIEKYNHKTGELTEIKSGMPFDLLGLNREEASAYAKEYTEHPGLEELEDGFETMTLRSFSSERVIFRKTYTPWDKDYKYSLGTANGYIVVYYLDHETVYEYTDIYLSVLPKSMQAAVNKKECRMDIHELYRFLENYSS